MKTYKYRIYPTKAQETLLNQQLEVCRLVYNRTLAVRKDSYEQDGKSLGLYDTQKLLTTWKAEKPQYKLVHSQVLQNVQVRVDLAFQAFFRRVKAGEDPGYPRFKGYGRYDSMCFPQYSNGVNLDGNKLNLSKIGSVKVKLHRDLCGTPKTVCIRRSSTGKWFATISCQCEAEPLPPEVKAVGSDVGLTSFATMSNGEKVDNPRFFRKDESALAKAQRRMSKLDKGTSERAKARKVVSRIHERVTNRRTDFAHKLSRTLVNAYGTIVFEDLNITNMIKNGHLSKSIADAAWNQLVQFTTYKAVDAGRLCVQVDPRNTSKRCSRCNTLVDKDLSVRVHNSPYAPFSRRGTIYRASTREGCVTSVHNCPKCGLVMDRDENAAINILALGLQRMGIKSLEAHSL